MYNAEMGACRKRLMGIPPIILLLLTSYKSRKLRFCAWKPRDFYWYTRTNAVIFIDDSKWTSCIVMAEGGSFSVGDSVVFEESMQELLDFFVRVPTEQRRLIDVSTLIFTGLCVNVVLD